MTTPEPTTTSADDAQTDRGLCADAAIVGAGLAGLTAARVLSDAGLRVRVFDKGRGPGGRMSTRRVEVGGFTRRFDHGAQYFTARDDRFRRACDAMLRAGVIAPWAAADADARSVRKSAEPHTAEPHIAEPEARFVGVPAMNSVIRHLGESLPACVSVEFGTRVARARRADNLWSLVDDAGAQLASARSLIVAIPPEQACELLEGRASAQAAADRVVIAPCWAAMFAFDARVPAAFSARRFEAGPIAWAAHNSTKPGRSDPGRVEPSGNQSGTNQPGHDWVVHASPTWSRDHLEDDRESVASSLHDALGEIVGAPLPRALARVAHRWRYALVEEPLGEPCVLETHDRLALAGDWCLGGRVESAFLSGLAAGEGVRDLACG